MDPQQPRQPAAADPSLALRLAARLPIPKLEMGCPSPSSWLDTFEHACHVIGVPSLLRFRAVLTHAEPKVAQWLSSLQPPSYVPSERTWDQFYRPRIISRLSVSVPNEQRMVDRPQLQQQQEEGSVHSVSDDESDDGGDDVSVCSPSPTSKDNRSLHSVSSPSPPLLQATSPPMMPPSSPSPQTSPVLRSATFTPSRYRHLPPPPRAALIPPSAVYIAPKHVRPQPDHPSDAFVDIIIDKASGLRGKADEQVLYHDEGEEEYGYGYHDPYGHFDPYSASAWSSYPYYSGYPPPHQHQAAYYHHGPPPALYHPAAEWNGYSDLSAPPPPPRLRSKPPTHQASRSPPQTARGISPPSAPAPPPLQNKRRKLSPETLSRSKLNPVPSATSPTSIIAPTLPPRPSTRPLSAVPALPQGSAASSSATSTTLPIPSTLRIHIIRGISALQRHTGPGIWSTTLSQTTFPDEWIATCPSSSNLKSLLFQCTNKPTSHTAATDADAGIPGRLWLLLPRASSTPTALYLAHTKPLVSAQLKPTLDTFIKRDVPLTAHVAATGGQLWLWLEEEVARAPSVTDARWVNGLVFPVFIKMRAAQARAEEEYRTVNVAYLEGKRVIVNNYSRIGVAVGMPATKFFVRREVASVAGDVGGADKVEYPMLLVRQSWEKNGVGTGDVVVVHPAPSVAAAKQFKVGEAAEEESDEVTEMEVDEVMDGLLLGMGSGSVLEAPLAAAGRHSSLPPPPPPPAPPRIPSPVRAAAAPPAAGLTPGAGSVSTDGLSKAQRKKLRKKLAAAQGK